MQEVGGSIPPGSTIHSYAIPKFLILSGLLRNVKGLAGHMRRF